MNNNKDTFVLHASLYNQISLLSNEQAGLIFKATLAYVLKNEEPSFAEIVLSIVWAGIKTQIDENAERYEARCLKNKENIRKRWNKADTNVSDENEDLQSNTNVNKRIPNDMKLNVSDMKLGDINSTTTQLSKDNVSVCENNDTHTRAHEAFLKFKEMYKDSCPRLANSSMSQPNERGFITMYKLCKGDTQKMWAILIQMNNKKETTDKFTSVTQTFQTFFERVK